MAAAREKAKPIPDERTMSFEDQLRKAISRGQDQGTSRREANEQEQLNADALKNRHNQYRLQVSDHIEVGVKKLCEHFPGFTYETIYGDRGWGGAVYRDDITRGISGKSGSFYSRLEITVRPINEFNVLNISGKGTVHNREQFNWNFFREIQEVSIDDFKEKVDSWILVYAEKFASV